MDNKLVLTIGLIAFLVIVGGYFPLVGLGIICGVFISSIFFFILKPIFDVWVLERKRKHLVDLKKEIERLEKDFSKEKEKEVSKDVSAT